MTRQVAVNSRGTFPTFFAHLKADIFAARMAVEPLDRLIVFFDGI
jgi:hypothetical protein